MNLVGEDEDFLEKYVTWGLWALAVIVIIATVTGLVESYNGLYIWFSTHGITGFWADWAPVMIDGLSVVGEIAVFTAISRRWSGWSRFFPWIAAGLANIASIAGNVGTQVSHPWTWMVTAAVPPVVALMGVFIGLGVLKRIAKDHSDKRAASKVDPGDVADQLMKDNRELARLLQEARSTQVVNISPETPDQEFKGLDVLIPPTGAERQLENISSSTNTTPTVSVAEPENVSRETARMRGISDLRPGRQVIRPDGMDVRQTGSWSVIPD